MSDSLPIVTVTVAINGQTLLVTSAPFVQREPTQGNGLPNAHFNGKIDLGNGLKAQLGGNLTIIRPK